MLAGCTRYFSRSRPETKIVAVDSACSFTFDGFEEPRFMSSLVAPDQAGFVENRPVYATVSVPEVATVLSCRYLARSYGVLAGRSTGSVMTAVLSWRVKFHPGEVVVAIAADTGEEYLETIYNDEWVIARFGGDALLPERYAGFLEECVTDCEAEYARCTATSTLPSGARGVCAAVGN
jgi:cysteine synthase A